MRSTIFGLVAFVLSASCATPVEAPPNIAAANLAQSGPTRSPQVFAVSLASDIAEPQSGRLIVLAQPAASVRLPGTSIPIFLGPGGQGWVAAEEVVGLSPGAERLVDADRLAFPRPMSEIPAGEYWVQLKLDTDHNAAYSFSTGARDLESIPARMRLPAAGSVPVTLHRAGTAIKAATATSTTRPPETAAQEQTQAAARALDAEVKAQTREIDFVSPSLSEFWGRPMRIRGIVLLPPGYDGSTERYPAVYRTEGFGGTLSSLSFSARKQWTLMKSGETPPMIRVFLDHSSPWGTHEFADSVNNGPWGTALTEELIPELEKQYRMDAKPSGRFVTGHSSGGWFAIWQQVRYPEVYGGSWARSPDPVDFRSFTGIDIYRDGANAYVRPNGSAQYLMRDATGKETTSFREYAQQEDVLGDYGGQIDSFDWVFSPRGNDGRPQPLFDRATGKVDPAVAKYWRDNYDISHIVRRDWPSLKPVLDGKIHLIMGTMDTFHLDEAAKLLEQELKSLGAKADFFWMEGRGHGNIDRIGDDPDGLEKKIAWEMWAVARPNSLLKPKPRT